VVRSLLIIIHWQGKIGVLEKNDFSAEFKTIYENYTKLGEAKTAGKYFRNALDYPTSVNLLDQIKANG